MSEPLSPAQVAEIRADLANIALCHEVTGNSGSLGGRAASHGLALCDSYDAQASQIELPSIEAAAARLHVCTPAKLAEADHPQQIGQWALRLNHEHATAPPELLLDGNVVAMFMWDCHDPTPAAEAAMVAAVEARAQFVFESVAALPAKQARRIAEAEGVLLDATEGYADFSAQASLAEQVDCLWRNLTARIDARAAEIERLKADADASHKHLTGLLADAKVNIDRMQAIIEADEAENARLKARLAEAERDSAPLDWLERHPTPFDITTLRESECSGDFKYIENFHGWYRGKTIRAAIDAAMQPEQAKEQ